MLNRCDFIGNLGSDPEVRQMPGGGTVANFSVACNEKWKDKQTGQMQERTEWVKCVAFNRLGEICQQYLHKGDRVYVSGSMRTRKWQGNGGEDKYTTEIVLSEMKMLGGSESPQEPRAPQGRGQPSPRAQRPAQGPTGAPQEPEAGPDIDDDIPF